MSAAKTRRWLAIFDLLPTDGPGYTVERIVDRLGELDMIEGRHRRTILRDLAEMESSGIVQLIRGSDPDSGHEAWRLEKSPFGQTRMTPLGASVLKMSIQYMEGLLPPAAFDALRASEEAADRVLRHRAAEHPGVRRWADKVRVVPGGHALLPPVVPRNDMQAVYAALASDRQIRATYHKPGAPPVERTYHPLALLVRPPKLQLVVHRGRDPFVLNLHRMSGVEVLDARVEVPATWDFDAWLREGNHDSRLGDRIRLCVDTTPALAEHWATAPLGPQQAISRVAEGALVRVEADVVDTEALRRYLLSLGDQLVVRQPAAIAEWLAQAAMAIAARYDVAQTPAPDEPAQTAQTVG